MKKVVAMMLVLVLLAATLVACAKPAASQEQADTTQTQTEQTGDVKRCGGKEAWHYPERNKRRLWLQPEFRAAW